MICSRCDAHGDWWIGSRGDLALNPAASPAVVPRNHRALRPRASRGANSSNGPLFGVSSQDRPHLQPVSAQPTHSDDRALPVGCAVGAHIITANVPAIDHDAVRAHRHRQILEGLLAALLMMETVSGSSFVASKGLPGSMPSARKRNSIG